MRYDEMVQSLMTEAVRLGNNILIPDDEIRFTASRSGGPGGQNVNKVNTRVTLYFDLINTRVFSEEQKQRIRQRLATRISKQGILRVVCQRYRSQSQNRRAAIDRLVDLLELALEEERVRRKTRMPKSAKRKRSEDKSKRSQIKKLRSKPVVEGE